MTRDATRHRPSLAPRIARRMGLRCLWLLCSTMGLAQASSPTATALLSTPPSQHAPFFAQRITGYLTTRDGVALRYSALLPDGPGPFPSILNYSGYDPGAIGGSAYLADNTAMSVNLDASLVGHGYAVVGVNARGTGCSDGSFDFLGAEYGLDGRDAIEFIAAQPWSDGNVGMANWSWAGMSQLATAAEQPAHLRAIAPGMTVGDIRLDSWAPGGVPAPAFVAGWWGYLHERWQSVEQSAVQENDQRCLNQLTLNRQTAETHHLSHILLQHPLRDAYIEARHLAARAAQITVPILSMTAFQDEAVTSRDGHYQDRVDPKQLWVIQTNGGHDLYESLRFRETLIAFFDRFLKHAENGFEARPHAELWLESQSQGSGHARQESVQPGMVITSGSGMPSVQPQALWLSDHGLLSLDHARGIGRDQFQVPLPSVAVDADDNPDLDRWGRLPTDWRRGSVAYTSPPLTETWVTVGSASADLWVSLSPTADADIQVTLTEVRPDGMEMYIQRGWLRLSDRAVDPLRSTPLQPTLLDRPDSIRAMPPDTPELVRIEINKFAHAFRTGSRIRLWIDSPGDTGGYGFAPYSPAGRVDVWHDAAHPSRLVLGRVDSPLMTAKRPACGTVLKQPCRADPLDGTPIKISSPRKKV